MNGIETLKHEILEVIEDCISILNRGNKYCVDEYEYLESAAKLECARNLLDASKIYFKPVSTEIISIH
jgi:hypothetical protein